MDTLGGPTLPGMIERIKAILLKPVETWPTIAAEPSSPGELITRWAMPLAASGPVATFLHGQLFGYGALGISYSPGLMGGLSTLVVSYVMGLVGVVVLALIADWLAPKFGGTADRTAAFKLVAYGSTAAWLAGIAQLIPGLGILAIAGLYSLYLYFTGAAPLMKVPQDKGAAYTAVTIVCAVLLYLVVGMVSASFLGLFGMGGLSGIASSSGDSVKVNLPGGGSIDTSKIEQAGQQMEDLANGKGPKPIEPAKLQALLPATLGGFTRTALESNGMGQMGVEVEGTYTQGDMTIKLTIVDSSGLGALASGIGGALGMQHSSESADGYERAGMVDGQIQSEKWNTKDSRGSFMRQVGGRFMITAAGQAGSIDELKAAVAGIDQNALAALAN